MSFFKDDTSRALVPYSQRAVQRINKNENDSDVEQDYSDKENRKPTKSTTQSRSLVPSTEELDRMERFLAFQERAAALREKRVVQGHTYGNITVSGNARAIRGNLVEDGVNMPFTYKHTYGVGTVHGNGIILDGDISVSALKAMRQNQPRRA